MDKSSSKPREHVANSGMIAHNENQEKSSKNDDKIDNSTIVARTTTSSDNDDKIDRDWLEETFERLGDVVSKHIRAAVTILHLKFKTRSSLIAFLDDGGACEQRLIEAGIHADVAKALVHDVKIDPSRLKSKLLDLTQHDGKAVPVIRVPPGAVESDPSINSPFGSDMPDVFISKKTDDTDEITLLLYFALTSLSIRVFIDTYGIPAGTKIGEVLWYALRPAKVVVAFLSDNLDASKWCKMELCASLEWHKTIVPVFYKTDPAKMPADLKTLRGEVFPVGNRSREHEAKVLGMVVSGVARQVGLVDITSVDVLRAVAAAYRRMELPVPRNALLRPLIKRQLDQVHASPEGQSLDYYVEASCCRRVPSDANALVAKMEAADEKSDGSNDVEPMSRAIESFFASEDERVMLVLGDAGAGKSLMSAKITIRLLNNSEQPWVAVRLELKFLSHKHDIDSGDGLVRMLQKQAAISEDDIAALQAFERVVFVLDGYDELRDIPTSADEHGNLYRLLGVEKDFPHAKVIVTCRSQTIPSEAARARTFSARDRPLCQRFILPFRSSDMVEYVKKRANEVNKHGVVVLEWREYKEALKTQRGSELGHLLRNPFVLRLFVEALPTLKREKTAKNLSRLSRFDIYATFVRQWFDRESKKDQVRDVLRKHPIDEESLLESFHYTAERLSWHMYERRVLSVEPVDEASEQRRHRQQKLVGHKSSSSDGTAATQVWQEVLGDIAAVLDKSADEIGHDERLRFLQTSPLRLSDGKFSFVHKSFWEYFVACWLMRQADRLGSSVADMRVDRGGDVVVEDEALLEDVQRDHGLRDYHKEEESKILLFMRDSMLARRREAVEACKYSAGDNNDFTRRGLWCLVMASRRAGTSDEGAKAAANAITVLYAAEERLCMRDLSGIRVPGANLMRVNFDTTNLTGGDMRNVDLRQAWLKRAVMNDCALNGARMGAQVIRGCEARASTSSFSPDGTTLVSGSYDLMVSVWDVESGTKLLQLQGHSSSVSSVGFSTDGSKIVSGSYDKTVRVWDVESGTEVLQLQGHTDGVSSVSFSPDGSKILSGSYDKTVRVWDVDSGTECLQLQGHSHWVKSVSFSPDGLKIISCSADKTIRVWNAESGAELLRLKGNGYTDDAVNFSPDCTKIASGSNGKTVRVWDIESGTELLQLQGHSGSIKSVSFSPDGTKIASGSADKTVRVWDVESGTELLQLEGHSFDVRSVNFSPDGTNIVSGSEDKTVRVWSVESGTELLLLQGHRSAVNGVCFSPNGTNILSSSDAKTLRVWDVESSTELLLLQGHRSAVRGVNFSSDGTMVVTCSDDKTVRVWDVESGTELSQLQGHDDPVWGVRFSHDGTKIVSGSDDSTARVWDVASGTELSQLRGHRGSVRRVSFYPDGAQIVSSTDDAIFLWDVASGKKIGELQEWPFASCKKYNREAVCGSLRVKADGLTVRLFKQDGGTMLWCAAATFGFHIDGK